MIDLAFDNRIVITNELDLALQEIDILFNTENTELIGDPSYGVDFEQFLWILTPTTSELEKYIREKLNTLYFLNQFEYQVHVDFEPGEIRSIYHVTINIYISENQYLTKQYELK